MNEVATSLTAQVPVGLAGRRFDAVLAELFPDFSRSRLTGWIKAGDALLDGRQVPPRHLVVGGEQVSVTARIAQEVPMAPEDIALDVRYEDADVMVLHKPAGLIVHPGAGNPTGTLQNALLNYDPALAGVPRAGIVHRLDKDTSGLMVVARSLRAHHGLVEQLSSREMHRQYEALVVGTMIAGGSVDAPIGRHPRDRIRQAVVDEPGGKPAVTHYRVRERFRAHTLLQCNLETGRTHQIRVHMAHLRHALIGDSLYGRGLQVPKGATEALTLALRGFKRQALHAERIAFVHPVDGRSIEVEAVRPADFEALLVAMRDDSRAAAEQSAPRRR